MPSNREHGVDIARGLALISMYLAHTAPSTPGDITNLSEFSTLPLFAMLIGMGMLLSWRRHSTRDFLVGTTVRAVFLVLIDLAVGRLGAAVWPVLIDLALLMVVLIPLVWVPSWALLALSALLAVASPWIDVLVNHAPWYPYRLTTLAAWGVIGIVLARWLPGHRRFFAWTSGAALVVMGALLIAKRLEWLDIRPYTGTTAETVLNASMALVVIGFCLAVSWPGWLARPLVAMGQMTLTLYALQLIALAAWIGPLGHATDDSWVVFGGLVVGSVLIALGWRWLSPRTRGPVEYVIARVVLAISSAVEPRARPEG